MSGLGLLFIGLGLASAYLLTPNSPRFNSSHPLTNANSLRAEPGDDVEILGVKGKSGYVKINEKTGSSLFYWLTQSLSGDIETDTRPLILWLNGGPGCASVSSLLTEFGPLYIDENIQPQKREVTWAEDYHLLFIDNPLGAGYSIVASEDDYTTTSAQAAEQLYYMITQLNIKYPSWFKRDFYIFGESYAGHWVPAIAHKILTENKSAQAAGTFVVPLKGIGIGDGWTDPINQLTKNAIFGYSTGLTNEAETAKVAYYEKKARNLIRKGKLCESQSAFNTVFKLLSTSGGGVNIYNLREFGDYNFDNMVSWANTPSNKDLLHVPQEVTYLDCNTVIFGNYCEDLMTSVKNLMPDILDQIPILLYNGQDDVVVNTPSAENWIAALE
jgi:vitellogenic carboxypeptidase-like protein